MDRYKVLDLIGEGSFGRVFRGLHRETGASVALKLIPKVGHSFSISFSSHALQVGHSERELRSLRSECKIQRELDHPNIVKMIDAFETDNEVSEISNKLCLVIKTTIFRSSLWPSTYQESSFACLTNIDTRWEGHAGVIGIKTTMMKMVSTMQASRGSGSGARCRPCCSSSLSSLTQNSSQVFAQKFAV